MVDDDEDIDKNQKNDTRTALGIALWNDSDSYLKIINELFIEAKLLMIDLWNGNSKCLGAYHAVIRQIASEIVPWTNSKIQIEFKDRLSELTTSLFSGNYPRTIVLDCQEILDDLSYYRLKYGLGVKRKRTRKGSNFDRVLR